MYQNKFCYNGVFYCYYVTKTECQGCYYKLPGPKSCDGCTEIIWLVQSEVEKPRNNSSSNHELLWSPAGEEKEEQCLGPQCGEQNRPRIWEVLNHTFISKYTIPRISRSDSCLSSIVNTKSLYNIILIKNLPCLIREKNTFFYVRFRVWDMKKDSKVSSSSLSRKIERQRSFSVKPPRYI